MTNDCLLIMTSLGTSYAEPTAGILPSWAQWAHLAVAAIVGAIVWAQGWLYRHRRRRAWPKRVDWLTCDYPTLPGFDLVAGILGFATLVLTVYYAGSWFSPLSAGVMGVSSLAMAARRWSRWLAQIGLALITAAVVLLPMPLVAASVPIDLRAAGVWPLAAAVVGLAVMSLFWRWLAGVWRQQLHDGRPWTTAGAMMPDVAHFGRGRMRGAGAVAVCPAWLMRAIPRGGLPYASGRAAGLAGSRAS
jgi:hypothetical protein